MSHLMSNLGERLTEAELSKLLQSTDSIVDNKYVDYQSKYIKGKNQWHLCVIVNYISYITKSYYIIVILYSLIIWLGNKTAIMFKYLLSLFTQTIALFHNVYIYICM